MYEWHSTQLRALTAHIPETEKLDLELVRELRDARTLSKTKTKATATANGPRPLSTNCSMLPTQKAIDIMWLMVGLFVRTKQYTKLAELVTEAYYSAAGEVYKTKPQACVDIVEPLGNLLLHARGILQTEELLRTKAAQLDPETEQDLESVLALGQALQRGEPTLNNTLASIYYLRGSYDKAQTICMSALQLIIQRDTLLGIVFTDGWNAFTWHGDRTALLCLMAISAKALAANMSAEDVRVQTDCLFAKLRDCATMSRAAEMPLTHVPAEAETTTMLSRGQVVELFFAQKGNLVPSPALPFLFA